VNQYQGASVINYTDKRLPYTRMIEHKHFNDRGLDHTIVTKEYSEGWNCGSSYYPSSSDSNGALASRYRLLADSLSDVSIGGRLGCYKYFNMDESIKSAMNLCGAL